MVGKKFYKSFFILALSAGLVACSGQQDNANNTADPHAGHNGASETSKTKNKNTSGESTSTINLSTKNVTRLHATNPIEAAIGVSQTIWPSTHDENKPGTVILAPVENWQVALASTNLIHHPNNGPVLYYKDGKIPAETLDEIKRLGPLGNTNGTEIMVMGSLEEKETEQLKDYKVETMTAVDPAQFAQDIDKKYAEITGEITDGVIIVSVEDDAKLHSIIAANWIAHMPEPILFVTKDDVPEFTKQALSLRNNKASLYILGPESVISKNVEDTLSDYGKVTRIAGETPTETSLAFAKFKDQNIKFGWGISNPGHGLEFVSTESPEMAIVGAPFAHLGKHAPMIWLDNGEATDPVHEYLGLLKPTFKDDPTVGPYTHVYLLGSTELVSRETQGMIDLMIEISPEDGGGHGGH
ncbi:cell wall-binding repeat-containing protein [Bacillus sp. 31A1R]|uniref:Cell wall-binding repeat-containing protein n=1 Tax=Robertmurraya mangrovi TaxID=3098077 RepID=A0ABU5J3D9_9BACI|nr:cell wall-binding repeat-containing protein [Bacillus sp. 31A1R]MDZ5473924.1 cell wall-binding repeat-containing protein [Bacillus sp. 31A1R]